MTSAMDKTKLVAFVEGELSPDEAEEVVAHLASHPEDRAYVETLLSSNALLQQAFVNPPEDGLSNASGDKTATRRASPKPSSSKRFWPFALGGFAVVIALAEFGFLLPGQTVAPVPAGLALGPVPATDPVVTVLETRATGAEQQLDAGRAAKVLATFRVPDGRYCREVQLIDAKAARIDLGLACRLPTGWRVDAMFAQVIAGGQAADYLPADHDAMTALKRYVLRTGAPEPLDATAEAEAMGRGWTD